MNVAASTNLAVSLFLLEQVSSPTAHPIGLETTYISQGNQTGEAELAVSDTLTSWFFLTAIEVETTNSSAGIVALGDSMTDGFASTSNANHRWTDILSDRLIAQDSGIRAVLNAGLSGNRILHDAPPGSLWYGSDALNRFGRDVLAQARVKYIIVLEGINDIALPGYDAPEGDQVSASQIIAGFQELIQQAHLNGMRIYGCTLLPFGNAAYPGYYSLAKEAQREAVNEWIRGSNSFDATIDFDQVVRDPANPTMLSSQYDSGDHVHPNDAGYAAMGGAIDLSLFN